MRQTLLRKFLTLSLLTFFALSCVRSSTTPGSLTRQGPLVRPSDTPSIFRLYVRAEPLNLDPQIISSRTPSTLHSSLYRGLFRYDDQRGLTPEGAQSCRYISDVKILCLLNPEVRWSNGIPVTSEDYVRSFRHLIDPSNMGARPDQILNLKNAKKILRAKAATNQLGIEALSPYKLKFTFDIPDYEFLYKLASTTLAPRPKNAKWQKSEAVESPTNGPYQVSQWTPGYRIQLRPNPFYRGGHPARPHLEIYFIPDNARALQMYQQGRLDLLNQLDTSYIPAFRNRPDFLQVPVARFDFIGFGPQLKSNKKLRKALSLSLNFKELKMIYDALGPPGCPGLPDNYLLPPPSCLIFDLTQARQALSQTDKITQSKTELRLMFSQSGGNDVKRGMEWMQGQWLKHLQLHVELAPREGKVFIQELKTNTPPLFRKGISLDRPTCLAALEQLIAEDSDSYMQVTNPKMKHLLMQMQKKQKPSQYKKRCSDEISSLIEEFALIPLGKIHFTLLLNHAWTGWSFNSMNQLDLSQLHHK